MRPGGDAAGRPGETDRGGGSAEQLSHGEVGTVADTVPAPVWPISHPIRWESRGRITEPAR